MSISMALKKQGRNEENGMTIPRQVLLPLVPSSDRVKMRPRQSERQNLYVLTILVE
jgi:hypothetical protein